MVTFHRRRSHTGENQWERKKQKLREFGTNNPCNVGMKGHHPRRGQQTHCSEHLLDSILFLGVVFLFTHQNKWLGFLKSLAR